MFWRLRRVDGESALAVVLCRNAGRYRAHVLCMVASLGAFPQAVYCTCEVMQMHGNNRGFSEEPQAVYVLYAVIVQRTGTVCGFG